MRFLLALVLAVLTVAADADDRPTDLTGTWQFALDRKDSGIQDRWFAKTLDDRIQLPGTLQSQGHGDLPSIDTQWTGEIVDRSWFTDPRFAAYRQPGNVKVPFWLTPDRHYVGPAWYQREIEIPAAWQGKHITLTLERPHWETRVWVDDQPAGSNDSLSVAHVYDLSRLATPGKHRLTIRVDNRMVVPVGINSHSVSDHTQGNWNGIVGRIELDARSPVWIDDMQVYPDVAKRQVRIRVSIGNATGRAVPIKLNSLICGCGYYYQAIEDRSTISLNVPVEGVQREFLFKPFRPYNWDEFTPGLYEASFVLSGKAGDKAVEDGRRETFGMRDLSTDGTQFVLNGRKIMFRGTLECCIFPLTGHPPTDVDSWRRIVQVCKAHGLNHIRFHSWCPPEAAFIAADELGFYYQVECSSWASSGTSVGDGRPVDRWLWVESERILRAYGNHPSFMLLAYGNEPDGRKQGKFLGELVNHWKKTDPRRLYTSASGWPMLTENQYHSTPEPRIQGWGSGLASRINARPPETMTDYRKFIQSQRVPVVSHEIGQWCVYPNLAEVAKYTGPLKAKNFEIFREDLAAHHMLDQAHDFLMASGKLQSLCYKEEIESALRTPGFGGFQLLDLHDFPGQGTALVGVLDPFWDSKGYITPAEYHRFACETVPLARMSKRIWTNDETFTTQIELSHFGPKDLADPPIVWRLARPDGTTVAEGKLAVPSVKTGSLAPLGEIRVPLGMVSTATQLKLEVRLDGTDYANDWDLWCYPAAKDRPEPAKDVVIATSLDMAAAQALKDGKRVVLLVPPARVKADKLGRIPAGFSSIFWNTAWTRRQSPHTLGILCRPEHPALASFPTDFCSNWQWWELITRAHPLNLNPMPPELRPVVQVVDDWFTNRRLGLVVEAQVDDGRLLLCSIDLTSDWGKRPAARQMYRSLLAYAASEQFKPAVKLTIDQVQSLLLVQ